MAKSVFVAFVLTTCLRESLAAEWSTWRADAARSGYTADRIPATMSLTWSWRPTHPPQPAWPRDERMAFDWANRVVVAGGTVYFGSSADDTVTALDAATGAPKWTFFTGGPVRFAPLVWKDRLFVVSDDGWLYCLNAADGSLIDRWRGGPSDERVLGNGRMISKWPARGGPVIRDGVLYWGAGIWQSDGIYIDAMNPETGDVLWTNDDSGGIDMPQPHGGAQAKSGVSAQGYFMADADRLFVSTGRSVPAAFTRETGEFEYYHLQENTRRGGTQAILVDSLFYNGGYAFQTQDGALLGDRVDGVVAALEQGVVHGAQNKLRALRVVMKEATDRRGQTVVVPAHEVVWQRGDVPSGTALIVAAQTIVTSGGNRVAAVDAESQEVLWEETVDDVAWDLAAADGRLFVSTASGAIHCYTGAPTDRPIVRQAEQEKAPYGENERYAEAVGEIIDRTGSITEGYCLDLACGDGALAYELARQTNLHVVAVDADPDNVAAARRRLAAAGLYGVRVSVHCADPADSHLPKYFANLIVSGRSVTAGAAVVDAGEVLRMQRPYGGVACLGRPGEMTVTTRGPLAEAGEWTHLYSNAANTLCSTDPIKGPLSVLWFRDVDLELPQRHGRGPSPLFHEGRLFAEGLDGVRAVDAYNGRPLWDFKQEGILDAYNADHLAGTAITSSNMCVAGDSLFLRNRDRCFRIDVATGELQATYTAPPHADGTPSTWGYIACEEGILFGSIANEEHIVRHAYIRADAQMQQQFSESSALFAIDVASGHQLWRYDAEESIRHNAIAIGDGRVFLIDRALALDDLLSRAPARRGDPVPEPVGHPEGRLVTLDARTGEQLWDNQDDIFGTTLSFSAAHSVLLMSYQPTRFKLPSEVGGRMAAFHSTDGYRLWETMIDYSTRPLLNDDTIIAWPSALNLLSGEAQPFETTKSYGCGQLSGSTNLLLFRSGTLGYVDATREAGTENFGGIRPGCWINALPVGDLVLVPDASAGCSCSYQNRSWVALQGSE